MKIKIIPFNKDLDLPVRKHYNDAGADVFCPQDTFIGAGKTEKIPLGFGVEIPDGYMGLIYSRSGLSSEGLACEMPPIDSGYRGEIHAVITNHSDEAVVFEAGQRIGQLVIQPIVIAEYVTELGESRGDGAFGSTGV